MKVFLPMAAFALLAAGVAHAEDKITMAVSIPAADHGWTGGVVFHAMEEAKALEKQYPGLKVIVKTSPNGADQANALEDLTTQGINALVVLPHNPDELTDPIKKVKDKGVFITARSYRIALAGGITQLIAGRIRKRIRKAKLEKVPYVLVVGGDDVTNKTVAVNARGNVDERDVPLDDFAHRLADDVASMR